MNMMPEITPSLLSVEGLDVSYGPLKVLHEVALDVRPGECVGLVGESGSGKSTLGKTLLGLAPVTAGRIAFDGRDITRLSPKERRAMADHVQVVFQNPYGSLNPLMTVGEILSESLWYAGLSRAAMRERVAEALEQVQLPAEAAERLPDAFSGGQRQRIAIARAIIRRPRLIVCDEPVSALDLTTQAAVVDFLIDLQRQTGVAYLFISHDLGLVRRICHRVAVMESGRIVEFGDGERVTRTPDHPYSRRLLLASPVADPVAQAERRAAWQALKTGAMEKPRP